MGTQKHGGFTIIETMFFLAISSLLLITLLGGTTLAIQRQRYSDSVNTTQSFFQQQFSAALNVVNSREGQEGCNNQNIIVTDALQESPGASECLVLGRAIEMEAGSGKITAYHVVGRAPATDDTTTLTEDQLLQEYRPTLVKNVEPEEFDVPWGASVTAIRRSGESDVNRLLILRSPRSGVLYTYAYNTPSNQANASSGVSAAHRARPINVCIKSADLLSSTSVVSVSMSGGPEAVGVAFDIRNVSERC